MKSMGELMKEMGFNEEASFEAKKAFIKYMIQRDPTSKLKAPVIQAKKKKPEQLNLFDHTTEKESQLKKSS